QLPLTGVRYPQAPGVGPKVSHYPLDEDIDNLPVPSEDLVKERLRQLREQKEMQERVRKLLQNPELLKKLSEALPQEKVEEVLRNPQLAQAIAQTLLARDPSWSQILQKQFGPTDREALEKWARGGSDPGAGPKPPGGAALPKEDLPPSRPPDGPDAKAPP